MRKFADKEQTIRQSDVSTTESTLILSGYSRELANNCTVLHSSVLYCIKREGWKREKWENLMTRKEQTDGSKTETTLSPVDTRGSWPINIISGKIYQLI